MADLYVGALTAVGIALAAQFFVILAVGSQIIYLSVSDPVMMDMFTGVPVRFRDIIAIFFVQTLVLIPISAALTHTTSFVGLL